MDLRLKGKRIFVSGSTKGIGLAIAEGFLDEGATVFLNSRHSSEINDRLSELSGSLIGLPGDVTNEHDLLTMTQQIKDKAKGLDILVCNVGSGRSVPSGQEDHSEWQRILSINFFSTTNLIRSFLPLLESGTAANIVCISSICGSRRLGAPTTYSVAKSALNAFIKCQAPFLASKGIRINGISPGNIMFPGSVWDHKMRENPSDVTSYLNAQVPMKRLGVPSEISDFTCFLASERAAFCTGSIFTVDGGQTN